MRTVSAAVSLLLLATICYAEFVPEEHPAWSRLDHDTCGLPAGHRIVGGKDSRLGEYPWTVQVGTIGHSTDFGYVEIYYCGGSIITPLFVIGAAHCIPESRKRGMNVVKAGEYDTESQVDCEGQECAPPYQVRYIAKIAVHPYYNNPHTANDIMLLYLDESLIFNEYVRHICLTPSVLMGNTFDDMMVTVAGWGVYDISHKDFNSPILKAVTLPVWPNEKCAPIYKKFIRLQKSQMCVGGEIGKDACIGDSGGPLMKMMDVEGPPKAYLIGIVSIGLTACSEKPIPGIYTRVGEFEEWILDMIILLEEISVDQIIQ